ncbi:hypothetical protein P9112_010303 [Eukaryota sp. TZLM1-RC]
MTLIYRLACFIVFRRGPIFVLFLVLTAASLRLSSQVEINYDGSSYLPPDSETYIALNLVEEEFDTGGAISVMVSNVNKNTANDIHSILEDITGVDFVSFNVNDESHYSRRNALFQVTLSHDDYSLEAETTIKSIRDSLSDHTVSMSGAAVDNYNTKSNLTQEMTLIVGSSTAILVLVLTIMSTSYLHPLIFGIVVLVAIALNNGTNVIFENISYITNSISSVLQLGLSMDYSIILLNRYRQELDKQASSEKAMIDALAASIIPISSSSLTTIAGMMALTFMEYRMGRDIGVVLAKGIFFSLVSVFFIMSGLLVMLHTLCERTKKKATSLTGQTFANYSIKRSKMLFFLTAAIVAITFFIQTHNTYLFTDVPHSDERDRIESEFGASQVVMVLYEKEGINSTYSDEQEFIDIVEGFHIGDSPVLSSYLALSNTVYQPLVPKDLPKQSDMTKETANLLFAYYYLEKGYQDPDEIILADAIHFVYEATKEPEIADLMDPSEKEQLQQIHLIFKNLDNMLTIEESAELLGMPEPMMTVIYYSYFTENFDWNATYEEQVREVTQAIFDGSFNPASLIKFSDLLFYMQSLDEQGHLPFNEIQAQQFADMMDLVEDADNKLTFTEFATVTEIEEDLAILVYAAYFAENDKVVSVPVPARELVHFLDKKRNTNKFVKDFMSEEDHEVMDEVLDQLELAKINLRGISTQRIILNLDVEHEGDDTFATVEFLRNSSQTQFGAETFVAGLIVSTYDTEKSFMNDLYKINIITVVSIVILVMLAFMSLVVPILLIVVIQGAIWASMSISFVQGESIFFLSYLVVIAIQMGSAVDYAILLTSSYLDYRKDWTKKSALKIAVRDSFPTIVTSGVILMSAGLSVAFISSQDSTKTVGSLLARGTLLSMLFVCFLLPGCLIYFDSLVESFTLKTKFSSTDPYHIEIMLSSQTKDDGPFDLTGFYRNKFMPSHSFVAGLDLNDLIHCQDLSPLREFMNKNGVPFSEQALLTLLLTLDQEILEYVSICLTAATNKMNPLRKARVYPRAQKLVYKLLKQECLDLLLGLVCKDSDDQHSVECERLSNYCASLLKDIATSRNLDQRTFSAIRLVKNLLRGPCIRHKYEPLMALIVTHLNDSYSFIGDLLTFKPNQI